MGVVVGVKYPVQDGEPNEEASLADLLCTGWVVDEGNVVLVADCDSDVVRFLHKGRWWSVRID